MAVIIKLGAAGAGGGVGGFGDDDYGLFSTNPDFTIEDASSSSVTLKWSKPYSDVTITNYRVYKFKGDAKPTKLSQFGDPITTIGSGTSFTYTINNLTPGTYWFVITTLFYIDDELVENGSLQYEKSKQIVEYDWLICVPSGNSARLIGKSIDKILTPDMSNISSQISKLTITSFVPVANANQNINVLFAAAVYGLVSGATSNDHMYVLGIAFVGLNKMTVSLIGSEYDASNAASTAVAYRPYRYSTYKTAGVILDYKHNANNIVLVVGDRKCYSTPCTLDPPSGGRTWVSRYTTIADPDVTSSWDAPAIDIYAGHRGFVTDGYTALTGGDLTNYASVSNPVYYGWVCYDARNDNIVQCLNGITHSVSIQNGSENYFYNNYGGLFLIDNNVAIYYWYTFSTSSGNSSYALYVTSNWRASRGTKAGDMAGSWTMIKSVGPTDDYNGLLSVNMPNGTAFGLVNFPRVMFKKGNELYAYSSYSDNAYILIKTTYSGVGSIQRWTYVGITTGLGTISYNKAAKWSIDYYRYSSKTDSFYAVCRRYDSDNSKYISGIFASKDLTTFVLIKDFPNDITYNANPYILA